MQLPVFEVKSNHTINITGVERTPPPPPHKIRACLQALKSNNLRDLAPLESWSIQCANTGCASFIYLPHSLTFQLHPSVTTSAACSTSGDIKGVQEKLWFFTIHFNPSLTYIAVRDLQGSLNAMRVYSRSYWLVLFCTTNSSQVLARERWQTFENSWKKHNI